jgi:hypothetical protein
MISCIGAGMEDNSAKKSSNIQFFPCDFQRLNSVATGKQQIRQTSQPDATATQLPAIHRAGSLLGT